MRYHIISIAALLLSTMALQAQTLDIEHLAGGNTLVRVSEPQNTRYLLLPIEEKAPEAPVKIICGNDLSRTISVRLALDKVDYMVPLDLSEWAGEDIKFLIHLPVDRATGRDAQNEICWSKMKLSEVIDTENREIFRPAYHHTPEYGWMNDPNGMFYKDGEWHLYYQWGPYGSMWNNLTWGHSVSRDLIHWEYRPEAIKPDALGYIFSGSCVVDHNNTAGFGKDAVIALYTSAAEVQSQSLAYSLDGGDTFIKYPGNPILTADIADFRDPNMFWNEEIGKWNLILACGQEMRIYTSDNLIDWKEESRFGQSYGSHDGVWECPDLFKLPVEGTSEEKWVLFCNINPGGPSGGSATQYFIGDFDGSKFTLDNPEMYLDGKALWQDYGKDHYAAVSFSNAPDGRHTMIAWMSNWEYANNVPTMQFRSANTIAREPFLYNVDGKVYLGSRPSPEYAGTGLDKTVKVKGSCTVTLSNENGEEFVITYDQNAMTLSCDRSRSGMVDFSQHFNTVATAPVCRRITSFRIFVDNCSVEVFANDGEVCMTSLVFPSQPLNTVTVNKIK
ncbi:MAG: DUF4980 domain-containing protein [Candidatus Cryptobacteroides sp.]|uniref:DUF4980 domain-containing protein n=1 Tax=Candidatus Cryptobacteroides sp. TaxID=2952915 RepID=UPI002A7EC100|nr:DUF4980 domain-containing protein [Candidatus Cryptobacteroides sp.]MDY5042683.1 DUF4980 domain-containing protein [Candidatus Cryptobacteroides sp.]